MEDSWPRLSSKAHFGNDNFEARQACANRFDVNSQVQFSSIFLPLPTPRLCPTDEIIFPMESRRKMTHGPCDYRSCATGGRKQKLDSPVLTIPISHSLYLFPPPPLEKKEKNEEAPEVSEEIIEYATWRNPRILCFIARVARIFGEPKNSVPGGIRGMKFHHSRKIFRKKKMSRKRYFLGEKCRALSFRASHSRDSWETFTR